jgi:hypothetical protein
VDISKTRRTIVRNAGYVAAGLAFAVTGKTASAKPRTNSGGCEHDYSDARTNEPRCCPKEKPICHYGRCVECIRGDQCPSKVCRGDCPTQTCPPDRCACVKVGCSCGPNGPFRCPPKTHADAKAGYCVCRGRNSDPGWCGRRQDNLPVRPGTKIVDPIPCR